MMLDEIARAVFADERRSLEPRRVAAAALARWSRPPGGAAPSPQPADEGDRRWLWALALVVLLLEQVVRRGRPHRSDVGLSREEEARVA
jgi:hypothetical protein